MGNKWHWGISVDVVKLFFCLWGKQRWLAKFAMGKWWWEKGKEKEEKWNREYTWKN